MSKYLFRHLKELEEFKLDRETAVITDIDGTISDIAPTPAEAVVKPSMRDELVKLMNKFRLVAVISGRSVLNAKNMVGVEGLLYVGNHGLESLKDGKKLMVPGAAEYLILMKEIGNELKKGKLPKINGLRFEDKGVCLSIHYRGCKNPEDVRKTILETVHDLPQGEKLKVSEGRMLVECKPLIGYDKGVILENIIERHQLEKVIYLGDDITDLDAFKTLKKLENEGRVRGASVLVFSHEIPGQVKERSSFYVKDVDEVLRFFQWLLN